MLFLWRVLRSMPDVASIRVVIPTFNEERTIATCLDSLAVQTLPPAEVVVVDGGSSDATASLAESHPAKSQAMRVLRSPRRGRGHQIAYGLEDSSLGKSPHAPLQAALIVHADMRLDPTSLAAIQRYLAANPHSPGGCLGHRFAAGGIGMRLIEWGDAFRARRLHLSYGDQGQFVRLPWLAEQGGFPDQPILEDLELALRWREWRAAEPTERVRRPVPGYLDLPAILSGRRFQERGLAAVLWQNLHIRRRYHAVRRQWKAARRLAEPSSEPLDSKILCERIYREYYGDVPSRAGFGRDEIPHGIGPTIGIGEGPYRSDCADIAGERSPEDPFGKCP